jgi:hypothetical protein
MPLILFCNAIAPAAAEMLPMLVPTSQTGALTFWPSKAVTAAISAACAGDLRNASLIPPG